MATLKERLEKGVQSLVEKEASYGRRSNTTKPFFDIYVWQELSRLADDQLKKAWGAAQSEDGPLPDDDTMRDLGEGEHIVEEAGQFSCLATISAASRRFDKELFIDNVVKKFRIPRARVVGLAVDSTKPGTAALRKRIRDAE